MRLWEVCQTPDFRKTTQDEHARLIGAMFEHLTQGDRRLPEDWMQGQFASLDRTDGDIDALSIAARPGAHPGLCRQSRRLAGRSADLAGPGARASRTGSPTRCTNR